MNTAWINTTIRKGEIGLLKKESRISAVTIARFAAAPEVDTVGVKVLGRVTSI